MMLWDIKRKLVRSNDTTLVDKQFPKAIYNRLSSQ